MKKSLMIAIVMSSMFALRAQAVDGEVKADNQKIRVEQEKINLEKNEVVKDLKEEREEQREVNKGKSKLKQDEKNGVSQEQIMKDKV
ncbi:MAG: hypothetical protein ACXVB1_15645, partial [Pseudobdellovibrionaceae bacterium]